jgi:hypothetical protein
MQFRPTTICACKGSYHSCHLPRSLRGCRPGVASTTNLPIKGYLRAYRMYIHQSWFSISSPHVLELLARHPVLRLLHHIRLGRLVPEVRLFGAGLDDLFRLLLSVFFFFPYTELILLILLCDSCFCCLSYVLVPGVLPPVRFVSIWSILMR